MRKQGRKHREIDKFGGVRLICKKSTLSRRAQALSRPLGGDDEQRLIIPARVSMSMLLEGSAVVGDLHNIAAFLNVGLILSHNIGEIEARGAIQKGIFAVSEVHHRNGPRYAMNAEQRSAVSDAVSITDEVFTVSTLLELSTAHREVIAATAKGVSDNA